MSSLQLYRENMGDDYFSFEHKGNTFIIVNTQLWKTPVVKRKQLLNLFEKYGVEAILGGHTHTLYINKYNDIQLVNGETTSKNFDNRPLGFRVWHIEPGSSPRHDFIALGAGT